MSQSYNGNPPRALVRCWHCLEWTEPYGIETKRSPGTPTTVAFSSSDLTCRSCGALVATSRPHTISIPERSLAL